MLKIATFCIGCLLLASSATGLQLPEPFRWTRVLDGEHKVVVFRPDSKGKVVFAAPWDTIRGIVLSYDGGYTWRKAEGSTDPLEPQGSAYIRQIFPLPGDTNVVLAGSSFPHVSLQRSHNGGYDWKKVIEDAVILGEGIFEATDGSGRLYCGSSGYTTLYKSDDKGLTWDTVATVDMGSPNLCVLAGQPGNGAVMLAGVSGGAIYRSEDTGKTWTKTHADHPTGIADVPMIVFNPARPNEALATIYAYPGKGLVKTTDGGRTWRDIEVRNNQWALEYDPQNPDLWWMGRFAALDTNGGTFFLSTDGGDSWVDLGMDSITNVWQIDYDSASGRIGMATSNGLFIGETRPLRVEPDGEALEQLEMWPTPAQDVVFFSTKRSGELSIYDAVGKKLYHDADVHAGGRIDVASWARGVYYVQLRHKNGYDIQRLMLVR